MYGPEKFEGNLRPVLKFNDFPATATKLMVVNNGLTRLTLDTANRGGGFNLNLVCFMTAATGGQT
jgi:hypothetical protein